MLCLYRQILRTLKEVPDEKSKKELRDWAREEFERNKHQKDEVQYCIYSIKPHP